MKDSTKKINDNLVRFWDEAIALSEEDKKQLQSEQECDYKALVPSEKLLVAAQGLGNCHHVLDYGCGSGWASFVIADAGCLNIDAVDLGENIIAALSFYAELYGLSKNIHPKVIDPDWLSSVPSETYDGLICSNVLDVVPLETSEAIIKEMARIVTANASIVIGLNFYLSPEMAEARGMELVEGRYLFVNDVLRLVSRSDEDWIEAFSPYFNVEKLDHFAWPGEQKETRRLFLLKKKIKRSVNA